MILDLFPREVGPPRITVYSKKEMLDYINLYNGKKKAVYYSIYHFDRVENNKPKYDSAVLSCLFFDFDDKECNSYEETNKFHQYCLKENIAHHIIMSGRGYHFYVLTELYRAKNTISTIYNAQRFFVDLLNLKVDTHVIGDASQLARVPNTFNGKGNRFCIPLTREQFEKGDLFIRKLAEKQNFIDEQIGNNKFKLDKYDYETKPLNLDLDLKEIDLDLSEVKIEFPPCLLNIIKLGRFNWKDRYLMILYLKEKGFSLDNTYDILKQFCPLKKLNHCINEERQLQYLFKRDDLTFPGCNKLQLEGYCKGRCDKFEKVIYKK